MMDSNELKEIIKKHNLWLNDENGGVKADLAWANLRGANLRGADLARADLTGADLAEANLFDVAGNRKEIRTISIERYTINYTKDRIQIGCKNYSIDEWFAFSDGEIERMDDGAIEWWNKWKGFIKQAIELSLAE